MAAEGWLRKVTRWTHRLSLLSNMQSDEGILLVGWHAELPNHTAEGAQRLQSRAVQQSTRMACPLHTHGGPSRCDCMYVDVLGSRRTFKRHTCLGSDVTTGFYKFPDILQDAQN